MTAMHCKWQEPAPTTGTAELRAALEAALGALANRVDDPMTIVTTQYLIERAHILGRLEGALIRRPDAEAALARARTL